MKEILVELDKCLGCKSCELACATAHSESKNLYQAFQEQMLPVARIQVQSVGSLNFPLQCRHCEEPVCVLACMSGALFKDAETGVIRQKEEKCVGCAMCIMVCPYGVLKTKPNSKLVVKCDRCPDQTVPSCVQACPTKALNFDTIKNFTGKIQNKFLVNFKKV